LDGQTHREEQINIYTILARKIYINERFGELRGMHGNNTGLKRLFDKQALTTSGRLSHSRVEYHVKLVQRNSEYSKERVRKSFYVNENKSNCKITNLKGMCGKDVVCMNNQSARCIMYHNHKEV
jgi:hypothetical protein